MYTHTHKVSKIMIFPSIREHLLASETQEESVIFTRQKKNINTEA